MLLQLSTLNIQVDSLSLNPYYPSEVDAPTYEFSEIMGF